MPLRLLRFSLAPSILSNFNAPVNKRARFTARALSDSEARDAIYLQEIGAVTGAAQAPLHEDDYQEIAEFASAMEMKRKTFDV